MNGGNKAAWSTRFPVYQIDFTAVASGKRVSSSKRRVRWRFGFSNKEALEAGETGTACRGEEHDVTVVWSVTSGKRLILADGQEVHYSTSRSGVFEFSWTMRGNHVIKVVMHAAPPLSSQPGFRQYDLIVDGQSFFVMPKVYELGIRGPIPSHAPIPGVPPSRANQHSNSSSRSHNNANNNYGYYDLNKGQYINAPKSSAQEEEDLQRAIKNSIDESRQHISRSANRSTPEDASPNSPRNNQSSQHFAQPPNNNYNQGIPDTIQAPAPAPSNPQPQPEADLLDMMGAVTVSAPPQNVYNNYSAPPAYNQQVAPVPAPAPVGYSADLFAMPAPTPAAAVPYAPAAPPSQPYTPTQNYPNYNQLQQPPVPAPVADPNQFAVAPAPPQQQMQTPVYQPNQYSAPAAPPAAVAEPPAVPAIEQEVPSNNNLLTVDTSAPTKNPADSMMSKLVNIDDINSPVGGEDSLVGMFSKPIESSPNKGPQPTLAEMKSTKPTDSSALVLHPDQSGGYAGQVTPMNGTGYGMAGYNNNYGYASTAPQQQLPQYPQQGQFQQQPQQQQQPNNMMYQQQPQGYQYSQYPQYGGNQYAGYPNQGAPQS